MWGRRGWHGMATRLRWAAASGSRSTAGRARQQQLGIPTTAAGPGVTHQVVQLLRAQLLQRARLAPQARQLPLQRLHRLPLRGLSLAPQLLRVLLRNQLHLFKLTHVGELRQQAARRVRSWV